MKLRNSHAVRCSPRVTRKRGPSSPSSPVVSTIHRKPKGRISLRHRLTSCPDTSSSVTTRRSLPRIRAPNNGGRKGRVQKRTEEKEITATETPKKVLRSRNLNSNVPASGSNQVDKACEGPRDVKRCTRKSSPELPGTILPTQSIQLPKRSPEGAPSSAADILPLPLPDSTTAICARSSKLKVATATTTTTTVSLREIVNEIEKELPVPVECVSSRSTGYASEPPQPIPTVHSSLVFEDPHNIDLSAYEEFDFFHEEDEYCPNGVFDPSAAAAAKSHHPLFPGGGSEEWIPEGFLQQPSSSSHSSYAPTPTHLSPLLNFSPPSGAPGGQHDEYNQLMPSYVYNQPNNNSNNIELVPSSSSSQSHHHHHHQLYYNNTSTEFMTQAQEQQQVHHHETETTSSLFTLQTHGGDGVLAAPIYNYYTRMTFSYFIP